MKKISFLVTACLVACGLFFTQSAFALSSTVESPVVWTAYSSASGVVTFEINASDFGLYNLDDLSYYNLSGAYNELTISGDTLTVGGSLVLNTTSFGVYLGTGTGSTLDLDRVEIIYDYYQDSTYAWELTFTSTETGIEIGYADPSLSGGSGGQVPIPTAALLLGSGLIGLAGFKRKIGQNL